MRFCFCYWIAIFIIRHNLYGAWFIFDIHPHEAVALGWGTHGLFLDAHAFAVYKQFSTIMIGIDKNGCNFPFASFPVPVW